MNSSFFKFFFGFVSILVLSFVLMALVSRADREEIFNTEEKAPAEARALSAGSE
jgi:hypothetical protein